MRSAWQLTLDIWQWYLKHFWKIMKVSLWWLVALPLALPAAIIPASGLSSSGEVLTQAPEHFEVFLFFSVFATVGGMIVAAFVRPALISTAYAHLMKKELPPKKAFAHAKVVFWHYIVVMLLVSLIIGAGFFLFFIPGVIFGVYLMFSEQAAVLEDERHIHALKRSWRLVRGRFWKTLWRFFLPTAVFWLGAAGLSTLVVNAPLALLRGATEAGGPATLRTIITPFYILGSLVSAVTIPLFIAVQVFLYEDLRKTYKEPRREN